MRLLLLILLLVTTVISGCDVSSAPETETSAADTLGPVRFPRRALVIGGTHRVTQVVDGDTVTLETGRDVRMVGTQAPKLPLGRPNFEAWPLADAAKSYLEGLANGRTVTLFFGGRETDRYDRWLGHMVRDDGLWLQGAMLEAGFARVYTFPDNRGAVTAMLAAELRARQSKRGIWAHPFYQVQAPRDLEAEPERFENTYQIVQGRVESTGASGGRMFINFGGDWSTDFTSVISRAAQRRYDDAPAFDADRLKGARVEVRGWIELYNGPSIDITHPEQIVYLNDER